MLRWIAKRFQTDTPPDVELHFGLVYEGHDPYNEFADADLDYGQFYGLPDAGKFGGGIIGYFPEQDLIDQIRHSLNFFTPPFGKGEVGYDVSWRWQDMDLNTEDHQYAFSKSLKDEIVYGIYDPSGRLRGYMLDNPAAIYVVLAVLNQGPAPKP